MYRVKLRFGKLRRNSSSSSYSRASSSLPPLNYLNPTTTTTTTTTESTLASSYGLGVRGFINLYPPWIKYVIVSLDDDIGRQLKFGNLYPCVKSAMASLDGDIARRLNFSECVKSYGFTHSVDTFAMLVGIYSSANMYGEVRCLFLSIAVFCKSYYWKLLLVLLNEMVRLSNGSITLPRAYECLIRTLVESSPSMVHHALVVLFEAANKGIDVDVPLCNLVLKYFVDKNEIDTARCLFSLISVPDVYTFNIMMDLYTKGGAASYDLDEAEHILYEMFVNKVSPNEVTYAMFLRGLCVAGRVGRAWELVCNAQQDIGRSLDYNKCYNAVMLGFCGEGDMDAAMLVLTRMKDCGLSPDVHSYRILIEGFCNKGDVVKGYELFHEMVGCGIMPTLVICSSFVRCSKRGRKSKII